MSRKNTTNKPKSIKYNKQFNMLEFLNKASTYERRIEVPIESDIDGDKATLIIKSNALDTNALDALLIILHLCTLKDSRLHINRKYSSDECKKIYNKLMPISGHPDKDLDTIAVRPDLADFIRLSGKSDSSSTRLSFKKALEDLSEISVKYYGECEIYTNLVTTVFNKNTNQYTSVIHPRIAASILGASAFQHFDLDSHLSLKRDKIAKLANYYLLLNTSQKNINEKSTRYEYFTVKLNTILERIDHKFSDRNKFKSDESFKLYKNKMRSEFMSKKLPKLDSLGWIIEISKASDGDYLFTFKRPERFKCL
ncbi:hypothetical protein [Endozoicomonas ascidiicola]|uniref:hypothetical protein n=1 Tax=Endozoicomonas ascidiicola TaxID=1698521 RepID=UPI00082E6502|nr:hypothetical protein [Endozoicomonas ascidiicola]